MGARVVLGEALPPSRVAVAGRGVADCATEAEVLSDRLAPTLLLGVKEPVALPPVGEGV